MDPLVGGYDKEDIQGQIYEKLTQGWQLKTRLELIPVLLGPTHIELKKKKKLLPKPKNES